MSTPDEELIYDELRSRGGSSAASLAVKNDSSPNVQTDTFDAIERFDAQLNKVSTQQPKVVAASPRPIMFDGSDSYDDEETVTPHTTMKDL